MIRNSDNIVEVTVTGSDGLPIAISSLEDLEVIIYQKPKRIVQRFKLSDGNITIVNNAAGTVECYLDRANTVLLNGKNDDCKIEVVGYFADANFEDGVRREVDTDIQLAVVEESPTERDVI